jgi:hypothetical protein
MGLAFEMAWTSLSAGASLSTQQVSDIRVRLARAILSQVREGERDPDRLSQFALRALSGRISSLPARMSG